MFIPKGNLYTTHPVLRLRNHCGRVGTNNVRAFGGRQLQGNIIFSTQQDNYTNELRDVAKAWAKYVNIQGRLNFSVERKIGHKNPTSTNGATENY